MKTLALALLMAVTIGCTKPETATPERGTDFYPGQPITIIQGGSNWSRFAAPAWMANGYEFYAPGARIPADLYIPPSTQVMFGCEVTVLEGEFVAEFVNQNGVILRTITMGEGYHDNTWEPTPYNFPSTATSLRIYFTGSGGYLNSINLIKVQ